MIRLSAKLCHSFKIVKVGTEIHFQKINVAQVALVTALWAKNATNLYSSPLVYVKSKSDSPFICPVTISNVKSIKAVH